MVRSTCCSKRLPQVHASRIQPYVQYRRTPGARLRSRRKWRHARSAAPRTFGKHIVRSLAISDIMDDGARARWILSIILVGSGRAAIASLCR